MSINELLNDLKETYSFSSVTCSQKPDDAMTDLPDSGPDHKSHRKSQPLKFHRGILCKHDQHLRTGIKRYFNGNHPSLCRSKRTSHPHLRFHDQNADPVFIRLIV